MSDVPTSNQAAEEIDWWDHWNRSHRTEAFGEESDAARTGQLGLAEVLALRMPWPRILEVGCGTGWLAAQLADRGDYLGLDLSPAAIAIAKDKVPRGHFIAADFHTWQNPGAPFDVILMIDTIAYFRDQEAAIRKTRALLKPGGTLVLTTVNPFVYSRMSQIGPPGQGQVRNWLTTRALNGLLRRNGFVLAKSVTACPSGDLGILRLVNSRILNGILSLLVPKRRIRQLKEALGLGQYRLVLALVEDKNLEKDP